MALGSLSASCITLLDVLVCDHGSAPVMAWHVSSAVQMDEKTARRSWARLQQFKLVQIDRPHLHRKLVQATELGRAFIDAQYRETA